MSAASQWTVRGRGTLVDLPGYLVRMVGEAGVPDKNGGYRFRLVHSGQSAAETESAMSGINSEQVAQARQEAMAAASQTSAGGADSAAFAAALDSYGEEEEEQYPPYTFSVALESERDAWVTALHSALTDTTEAAQQRCRAAALILVSCWRERKFAERRRRLRKECMLPFTATSKTTRSRRDGSKKQCINASRYVLACLYVCPQLSQLTRVESNRAASAPS
jgi:hypothetical protein